MCKINHDKRAFPFIISFIVISSYSSLENGAPSDGPGEGHREGRSDWNGEGGKSDRRGTVNGRSNGAVSEGESSSRVSLMRGERAEVGVWVCEGGGVLSGKMFLRNQNFPSVTADRFCARSIFSSTY